MGIALVLLLVTAVGCSSGPEGAAKEYVEAMASLDTSKMQALTCSSQQAQTQFAAGLASLASSMAKGQQFKMDVGGLRYETARNEGSTAQVRVSGRIKVSAFGVSQEQDTSFSLTMRQDGGKWLYCGMGF